MSFTAVMQWWTGLRQKPCLPSERTHLKIHVRFKHHCKEKMPGHASACTNTIFFPVTHMNSYTELREIITTTVTIGRDFSCVQLTLNKSHSIMSQVTLYCIPTIWLILETYFGSQSTETKRKIYNYILCSHFDLILVFAKKTQRLKVDELKVFIKLQLEDKTSQKPI